MLCAQEQAYDQAGFPFGSTSPLNGSVNPSPLDDALRELASWMSQQNASANPSPTGSSHSSDSEQTVGLMMLLQELIHTQQAAKDTPGGRSSPMARPYTAEAIPSHRFSLDGAMSCLQGHFGLESAGLVQGQLYPASRAVPSAVRCAGLRVPASSESLGMAWGMGSGEARKRLSMDAQCPGRRY